MTDSASPIIAQRIVLGREYVSHADGSSYSRKIDRCAHEPLSPWTKSEPVPSSTPPPLAGPTLYTLSVVAEHQAEREPKHWFLFCHRPSGADETGLGQVWQVTGDAECMVYQHMADVDALTSADFAWHQVVNGRLSEGQRERAARVVSEEAPPRAINRRAVTENCQGWVIRVLRRLEAQGIVQESAIAGLELSMDPVNNTPV